MHNNEYVDELISIHFESKRKRELMCFVLVPILYLYLENLDRYDIIAVSLNPANHSIGCRGNELINIRYTELTQQQ